MNLPLIYCQDITSQTEKTNSIYTLIHTYAKAREDKDTVILKSILTPDVDQLVSSGKWRNGEKDAMKGMLQSSATNPGTRSLIIEKIRFLNPESAIVDTKYQITNTDGTVRNMWSTFIIVYKDMWKITAIRNMMPAEPQ